MEHFTAEQPNAGRTWLDEYRTRIESIRVRAEQARDRVATVTATARTRDGAVVVTVDASGMLTDLRLGVRAEELPRARLAETVLRLSREAALDSAAQVERIMAPLTAEGEQ
ncbi:MULTISPECIES: YbaB/EbfC family nucleoid-associated protein [Pseudonocardia]|uniref:YbaB/EbfC DNA-binding family protein n=1 Tax=Pseudonocardia alni TaxID=33907 RepID=A0AA44UQI8_PSEA5|nr:MULTISPECIES: YbaB/EbfC family nucleoid-associated protein [Pseudonocardia]MCO7192946.1 YbaB/EbfC family nucleoid-associated protein [Pseudonocardia sp. McavD-2-B]PKB31511.1 YbaB/EbfC DNA-binding family protein [Pseudonocardia alni]